MDHEHCWCLNGQRPDLIRCCRCGVERHRSYLIGEPPINDQPQRTPIEESGTL